MSKFSSPELFLHFCSQLFKKDPTVALTTHYIMLMYIKYQNLPEIGALPTVAQTTQQYLNLKNGEVALTNDPYSGGTILSNLHLIMGISTSSSGKSTQTDLLLVKKIPLKPKISLGKSIEEEGIRIPPTPVFRDGQINNEVLTAISEHDAIPDSFTRTISHGIDSLQELHKAFSQFNRVYKLDWSRANIKKFFNESKLAMQSLISEIRTGEHLEELELNDGSRLKLTIDVSDEKIIFDFSGSDNSESVHLTHSAALGACTGALAALFGKNLPINYGVFQCIEVVAPEGTMVHAKYPMPTYFGMTDGASLIANLVLKAIGQIDKSRNFPLSGSSHCAFDIEFTDKHFFETLEPGAPASAERQGSDGLNIWQRSHLQPSVEEIERLYPLQAESFS